MNDADDVPDEIASRAPATSDAGDVEQDDLVTPAGDVEQDDLRRAGRPRHAGVVVGRRTSPAHDVVLVISPSPGQCIVCEGPRSPFLYATCGATACVDRLLECQSRSRSPRSEP